MTTSSTPPQVVFACVRNGGRSVISRVLAGHYAGGRVVALSAGTQPGDHIHPEVAAVLEKLPLSVPISREALDMLEAADQTADPAPLVETFGVRPIGFEEQLRRGLSR